MGRDCLVMAIARADFTRFEFVIAETEMPGLMALRDEYDAAKVLKI